ncbi:glycosyltransferase [Pedobacter nototheniae]|uniref:glycosyltransferase n=1 Tax=Pedobacter nototheniae TaxID=2488994 RepID=UPI001038DA44|nr:glycosyltransferase [Pedobacter nototheniae]
MKKIIVLATYVGVINRGAETFVIELVKKLRDNYNVEVYSLGNSEEIKDNITLVDSTPPFWFKPHRFLYNKIYPYKVLCDRLFSPIPTIIEQYYFTKVVYEKFLKGRKDIDLLFPNNGYSGTKLASLIRQKSGTPFIYTGHGGIGSGEIKILLEKPDLYIALNDTHANWAKKFHNDVVKISNGVDVIKFNPETNRHPSGLKVVLCVGAFVQLKRQKLLIDAIEKLSDVKLILLGEGEMMNELNSYGQQKLKCRFEIKSVKYSEIYTYYNKCDLFSLPTKEEPFGIVYLEALAMNKPIVAPDDKSRREIIGEAGLFCDVEDSTVYSKTIEKALHMNWGNIPRDRAVSKFDWNIIASKYKEVIDCLIDEE